MIKKKNIIILSVILALVLSSLIFFAIKSHKQAKKMEDENNFTYKFDYKGNDNKLKQRITFIYEDKKLKDITITLYFENNATAKSVYKEYKSLKEFKDYKVSGKKVILYYKDVDVKDYKAYTKEEIIQEFESMGYIYRK